MCHLLMDPRFFFYSYPVRTNVSVYIPPVLSSLAARFQFRGSGVAQGWKRGGPTSYGGTAPASFGDIAVRTTGGGPLKDAK